MTDDQLDELIDTARKTGRALDDLVRDFRDQESARAKSCGKPPQRPR